MLASKCLLFNLAYPLKKEVPMPESDCCESCGKFLHLEGVVVCPKCEAKEED